MSRARATPIDVPPRLNFSRHSNPFSASAIMPAVGLKLSSNAALTCVDAGATGSLRGCASMISCAADSSIPKTVLRIMATCSGESSPRPILARIAASASVPPIPIESMSGASIFLPSSTTLSLSNPDAESEILPGSICSSMPRSRIIAASLALDLNASS